MTDKTVMEWRDGSGRTGRAWPAGIAKMLKAGRRLTVQRVDRIPGRAGQRAARIAASQLKVREVPRDSNRGAQVEAYQRATSVGGTGWPWCQAFVRWVWDRAGIHPRGYRGAYVPHFEAWARRAGKWSSRPVVGAAVVFDWTGDGLADHVGIVERVTRGAIVTIEGNTQPGSSGDQSNGGGVYRRHDRRAAQIRGYVHP